MKKVLVTGISGYIGNHCALELLKNGYSVKGSLRDLSKSKPILEALKREVGSDKNLEFCELDLLKDRGWDKAMKDCQYVLHIASPYINFEPKDENIYIKPAVDGTERALKSAKKAGIKRFVITSSMVAMLENANKSIDIDDTSWTNVNAENISAYSKSKTLAEKSAWNFIKNQKGESQMELVVINPGPVFGPTISGNLEGASMSMFKKMILGQMPMVPKSSINMSDVRDVAKIHVLALENKNAAGQRFIVTTRKPYKFQQLAKILKSNGFDKVSTKEAPNFLIKFLGNFDREARSMRPFIGKTYRANVSKTIETFDWEPINIEQTILDTAKSVHEAIIKEN